MQKSLKGALIATAVAGLFMAQGARADHHESGEGAEVKCLGVNECKGKGACGVPGKHDCHGQNECKGKGWIKLSKDECTKKGGTVLQ
jgi:uncharacterized membrane protein